MAATTLVMAATALVMTATATLMMVSAATVVVSTAALFVSATAATAVAATTAAATFAAQTVYEHLNFFVSCLATLHHTALEVELFACKRVVEVHLHLVCRDVEYTCHEVLSLLVLQLYEGVFIDVVVVEASVYVEHCFVKVYHTLFGIVAVSLA